MIAEVITVGDELLTGERVDTNGPWLGRYLTNQNVEVRQINTVGDRRLSIKQSIRAAINEVDLILLTGGLGPTRDDLTKKALQDLFQTSLTRHEPTLSHIRKTFKKRGLPLTESNYQQADVLANSEVLFNKQGTAPGMWFQEEGVGMAVLPGVPHEMKTLMQEQVQPKIERLESWKERNPVYIHYIQTAGIGESTLSDQVLNRLSEYESENLTTAFLPNPAGVSIRVNSYAPNEEQAEKNLEPVLNYIREATGDHTYHEGDENTLEAIMGSVLKEQGLSLAAAESCTGGLLMDTVTDVSGSSEYFNGGMVAYSNDIKQQQLGISKHLLEKHGAVSEPVALQMAKSIAKQCSSDIGVSTTGIAGPTGGTEEKPVGTVWIGYYSSSDHLALKAELTKERRVNKKKSVAIAMDLVRRRILEVDSFPYGLKPFYGTD